MYARGAFQGAFFEGIAFTAEEAASGASEDPVGCFGFWFLRAST
jgi:hypothetical protein